MTMTTQIDREAFFLTLQKNLLNFCKLLPSHVDKWRNLLNEAEKPVQALVNFSEQLRHVEKANISYLEDFKVLQDKLMYKIFSEIEDEIASIRGIIDRLHTANQEVKNKLSILEKSTVDLDWDEETPLIRGTAFQPPLSRILQEGYNYVLFFTSALKSFNDNMKVLNIRNEHFMKIFENKFKIDLESKVVINYLAIVQYIGNEKAAV
ncbi:uncharacterized protein LOC114333426 [Diabrotica virgifera virgifera]|uniref:Uncharacterized protein LOC114333426 n=1 Tax=Diabrotica virgifera virgifera TaxID=50390 RepID=A0A6P7FWC3_DIAVI|nr:uncharacterized protein LOC114333426 [Diabrotica virgifera virgifera]